MWLVIENDTAQTPLSVVVPLPEGELTVGRDAACSLIINDDLVSRRHVALVRRGDEVQFSYLGSATGLLLNGTETKGGRLAPNDRLTVGRATLRLHRELPPPPPRANVRTPLAAAAPPPGPRPSSSLDWDLFRKFWETLRRSSDAGELLRRLLQSLVDGFGAERGFVLLQAAPGAELAPVATHGADDAAALVAVSRTLYRRALETRRLLFVPDTWSDPSCAQVASVLGDQPRSVVCAPLGTDEGTFGVLYLDAPSGAGSLQAGCLPHLETMTTLASDVLAAAQTRASLLATRGQLRALNALSVAEAPMIDGKGPAAAELERLVEAAAPQDVSVLVTGETGTGKEMVARSIHRRSRRASGPFVPVNCAALPRDLVEAELFGAERGAFTGATDRRIGRFEAASGGTLFLDEIGELPAEVQVKLLRILQERSLTRLGGTCSVPLDFRLVCATNVDPEEAVRRGTMRQDLFFRINVFRVHLLPLRQRLEDLAPLIAHFLGEFRVRFGRKLDGVSPEALRLLESYDWPGNIRELRNVIERAVLLERSTVLTPEHLPLGDRSVRSRGPAGDDAFWRELPSSFEAAREAFERVFVERALTRHGGNVTEVARETGMTRNALYRRFARLGIQRPE